MTHIISVGMSRFGSDERSLMDHIKEAVLPMMNEHGDLSIDYMVFSMPYSLPFSGISAAGPAFASSIGMFNVPYISVENTSASGSSAILAANSIIESGMAKHVLVIGAEKMTALPTRTVSRIIASLLPREEASAGLTLPSIAAFSAKEYIEKFNVPRESIAKVAVKNHHNGSLNPMAHFRKEIPLDRVMSSRVIADPLRLFEFCPTSDGAAALLITADDEALSYAEKPVKIISVGNASDTSLLSMRTSFVNFPSVSKATDAALSKANLSQKDIDFMELHDMSSILEILELEAMGFSVSGKGWEMVETGSTAIDGELPVNTSGGLISRGHPLGATGVAQAVEIFKQLNGRAGSRQIRNPGNALSLNLAGYGNNATVIAYGGD